MKKAVDLITRVLKAYDWSMKDIWDIRAHLDHDFDDWQLETLATALARITTLTAQEALASLKSVMHELEDSDGALNKALDEKRKEDTQLLDAVADLARLKMAREILHDVSVEYWTDSPVYVRKLQKIDAIAPVKALIAEVCHIIGKLTEEA